MNILGIRRFLEEDLEPGEEILFRIHHHWSSFVRNSFKSVLILLSIIAIWSVFIYDGWLDFSTGFDNIFMWICFVGVFLYYLLVDFLKHWIDFYYDENIITTQRIIDIKQEYLFGQDIGITELAKIEDISLRHSGILSTLFDYADIYIQTSKNQNLTRDEGNHIFEIKDAPNPFHLEKMISEAVRAAKQKKA